MPSDSQSGLVWSESGSPLIAALVEGKAAALPNLSPEDVRELVGSVLVDLWRMLQAPADARKTLEDGAAREAWVEDRLASAFRRLRFGERKAYRQREVSLSEGLDRFGGDADVASQAEAELVFAKVVEELSPIELAVLSALLESSSRLVDDAGLARSLGLAPSTFSERKRKLLDRFREAFVG